MCRRIQCEQCHKPTFSGCGKHTEQVLRGITEADRCQCGRHAPLELAAVRLAAGSAQVAQVLRPA